MTIRIMCAVVLATLCAATAWAGFQEGDEAYRRGDYATALKEFRPLAEQGNAEAQYVLGIMYYHGKGVSPDDTGAHRWFQLAASQGHARAQTYLGITYHQGDGVLPDYAKALTWYRSAAEQGDPLAYAKLGVMYKNGEGVPPDYVQAHKWLNLAAVYGDEGEHEAAELRDFLATKMTPAQLAEAKRLAREWKPTREK